MPSQRPLPDPPLTAEAAALARALTPAQVSAIDAALLAQVSEDWRKIARVVGFAMMDQAVRVSGLPDIFYADRVRELIAAGRLESQGDVSAMGLGEVRLPSEQRRAI